MDGEPPEPIEVELTSHAPRPVSGGWRRRPATVEPPDESDAGPPGDTPGRAGRADRHRLAVVASVAAVLALVLGWMLGRATTGGSDAGAEDAAEPTRRTTTTVDAPSTLPLVGEEIGGADFEDPPATEPPRTGPTTTEPRVPTVEPIAVDARLAGVPVRLVGVEIGGALVEVDLAAGTFTDFETNRLTADGSPLIVGPDWVVGSWSGRTHVIRSDGTDSDPGASLGDLWSLLHVPGTELFWRTSESSNGVTATLELVDLDGEPMGPSIDLPINTWPYLVDPGTGGVVVAAAGRQYVVTPDTVVPLGAGEIVGITPGLVVAYDCDDALVCSLYRTDRATGERAPVPSDPELDPAYHWQTMAGWGGSRTDAVSPDGRWVAVIGSSWRTSVAGIVELATGRFVELAQLMAPPSIAWSPDGRFAFTLDDQQVMAYDTITGDLFPAFTGVPEWYQLGVRPPTNTSTGAAPEGAASTGATLLSVSPEQAVEG